MNKPVTPKYYRLKSALNIVMFVIVVGTLSKQIVDYVGEDIAFNWVSVIFSSLVGGIWFFINISWHSSYERNLEAYKNESRAGEEFSWEKKLRMKAEEDARQVINSTVNKNIEAYKHERRLRRELDKWWQFWV